MDSEHFDFWRFASRECLSTKKAFYTFSQPIIFGCHSEWTSTPSRLDHGGERHFGGIRRKSVGRPVYSFFSDAVHVSATRRPCLESGPWTSAKIGSPTTPFAWTDSSEISSFRTRREFRSPPPVYNSVDKYRFRYDTRDSNGKPTRKTRGTLARSQRLRVTLFMINVFLPTLSQIEIHNRFDR